MDRSRVNTNMVIFYSAVERHVSWNIFVDAKVDNIMMSYVNLAKPYWKVVHKQLKSKSKSKVYAEEKDKVKCES